MLLTKQDLDAIGTLIDEKLEEKLESKLEEKLDAKLDAKFEAFEEKMDRKFDAKLDAKFDAKFDAFEEKMDRKFDEKLAPIKSDIKELKKSAERSHAFQLKVEAEYYPLIRATYEGLMGAIEKNTEQDKRITVIEEKMEKHDLNIEALKLKVSESQAEYK